ncbi:MAG: glycosyl hydrolase family 65 protein [Acholeplasmataceae bacterium]
MAKIAQRYLQVDPWKLKEVGFHQDQAMVSESLFSLSNEYMGFRGYFDEGYPGQTLIGSYFNGIYEIPANINRSHYKGISDKLHYMVNATNVFYTRIYINGSLYIFNPNEVTNYERTLDFKTGESVRSYRVNHLFEITFKRILSMTTYEVSHQMIHIKPLTDIDQMQVDIGLDLNVDHWGKPGYWQVTDIGERYLLGKTTTDQFVYTKYQLKINQDSLSDFKFDKKTSVETLTFSHPKELTIEKSIASVVDRDNKYLSHQLEEQANALLKQVSYEQTLKTNKQFYQDYFDQNDIIIENDAYNQQGIRYCLFQLVNTYQGVSEKNNIGAKGLTGEAYSGHAFWDSETYCLPVYLFTNPKAARNLLMFRYNTLEKARKRAIELDCRGACYPIATLNGDEACDLWQHASLQFQPTSGVAYAIWHYVKNTEDEDFLFKYGFEMLVEIARFFSSRGQYNHDQTKFGYYGVMGPDEFQMMVNHNAYTNLMAKASMSYMIEVYETNKDHVDVKEIISRLQLKQEEINLMKEQCQKMHIPYDEETKIYEQHQGFHDLPHIDIHQIPVSEFPLYAHWSYDRIYRNDMIKQPDVLMFMFLFNQSFDLKTKKANYDYYEPKTIHESSLSPSIHSILAAELGYKKQALDFFGFATRMDIDDYNRNTKEGLHLTSIAAAWVNIVYGFGGLRSDGDILKLAPICPDTWKSYQFNIHYFDVDIKVHVEQHQISLYLNKDLKKPMRIYNDIYHLEKGCTVIPYVEG